MSSGQSNLRCKMELQILCSKLKQERYRLKQQVNDLAKFNYAREPEFVRGRKKLRDSINDVELLKRRVASETVLPILNKLGQAQSLVADKKRNLEKQSKIIKDELLTGQKVYGDQKDYDELIEQFIKTQKEAYKWTCMERLAHEGKTNLEKYVPKPLPLTSSQMPIAPPRQRKRVSLN